MSSFDDSLREAFAGDKGEVRYLAEHRHEGYRSISEELDDLLLAGEISPEGYFAVTARNTYGEDTWHESTRFSK
jgi:hypothetical protein